MIKTNRLLIRKISNDNDGQVARLLADQTLLDRAHLYFSTSPVTSIEVNLLLHSAHLAGIYLRAQPHQLVGLVMLDRAASDLPADVKLGYLLQQKSWGQGIMTEAVAGVVAVYHRPLVAVTDVDNYRSQHVLQKNGFIQVGQRIQQLIWQKPACTMG